VKKALKVCTPSVGWSPHHPTLHLSLSLSLSLSQSNIPPGEDIEEVVAERKEYVN
jgi:hypothetical protein